MSRPAWFEEALREMKQSGRAGLAVVVRQQGLLKGFSDSLQALLQGKKLEALRRRAVLVFLPEAAATACLPGLPEGHGMALLDASGAIVKSEDVDIHGDFLAALRRLLRKEDVERDAPLKDLPYGVEWAEEQHHRLFGTRYDPCAGCGMPRVTNNQSRLIRYLRVLDK